MIFAMKPAAPTVDSAPIRVTVACAWPDHAFCVDLALPVGVTVAEAIRASGFCEAHPDVEIRDDRVGVFARRVGLNAVLRDGDRVEIYRPLLIDPKEARRKRALRK